MRLEEKIMMLRKQKGLSQEELAYELNVSRQAVSKWEMGTATPDLDKIISMSELFNVSTDYLLKEDESVTENDNSEYTRRISKNEASDYINAVKKSAINIAIGVMLCVFSPIGLILLACIAEEPNVGLSDELAACFGLLLLFSCIISAVALFIFSGMSLSKYAYIDKEPILLANDAKKYVAESKESYSKSYITYITIGVVMCIFSVIPLIVVSCLELHDMVIISCVCLMLAIIGVATLLFVKNGNYYEAHTKLLRDNKEHFEKKQKDSGLQVFSSVFWLLTTALYLGISFLTNRWDISWLVWPIAGLIYAAIYVILESIYKSKRN
ncbi:MAG: helix-turn-helix transcriptional regulator [Erysipelotrichaceae bacterium]|nr:helix-turn-helix transcriptional regulator [Erysipelotrichaceae bacterium]